MFMYIYGYECEYVYQWNSHAIFHVALVVKNLLDTAGGLRGVGLIPESERSPRVCNGNPVPYSGLENPMDRGVWGATVRGVTKSWTRLSD